MDCAPGSAGSPEANISDRSEFSRSTRSAGSPESVANGIVGPINQLNCVRQQLRVGIELRRVAKTPEGRGKVEDHAGRGEVQRLPHRLDMTRAHEGSKCRDSNSA